MRSKFISSLARCGSGRANFSLELKEFGLDCFLISPAIKSMISPLSHDERGMWTVLHEQRETTSFILILWLMSDAALLAHVHKVWHVTQNVLKKSFQWNFGYTRSEGNWKKVEDFNIFFLFSYTQATFQGITKRTSGIHRKVFISILAEKPPRLVSCFSFFNGPKKNFAVSLEGKDKWASPLRFLSWFRLVFRKCERVSSERRQSSLPTATSHPRI